MEGIPYHFPLPITISHNPGPLHNQWGPPRGSDPPTTSQGLLNDSTSTEGGRDQDKRVDKTKSNGAVCDPVRKLLQKGKILYDTPNVPTNYLMQGTRPLYILTEYRIAYVI